MNLLERLRVPEHTGERRCLPCTGVNLGLVGLAALLVGRRRQALGLAVVAVGSLLVALRGYVVPYTPRFAPRLVAAAPVPNDWFGHGPPADAERGSLGEDVDGEALLGRLLEAGVLDADGEAVDLAPEFADRWHAEMDTLASLSTETLAEATLAAGHAAGVSVVEGTHRPWIVLDDGGDGVDGESWLSRPVAIAETAAVRALEPALSDPATRRAAAGPLRVFLTTCPDCDADLVESTTMDCCGGADDPRAEPDDVLACPACDARVHTFE
ncbi:hypothetical protein [Halosegnis sp.]|uniref:hypothetical protein n=1 Tax=Halosegnis sp. TaxID=2864959 RepID=UPI0035D4E517